jgi:hypothetical protein
MTPPEIADAGTSAKMLATEALIILLYNGIATYSI